MKQLEKIFNCKDVLLMTKIKITHTTVLPFTMGVDVEQ